MNIETAHGLAALIAFAALIVLVAHVIGFRVIFTAGRSV